MKLSTSVKAIAAAAILAASASSAFAVTKSLGQLTAGETAAKSFTPDTGSFTDYLTFNLAFDGLVGVSANETVLTMFNFTVYDIDGLAGLVQKKSGNTWNSIANFAGNNTSYSFDLDQGSYRFVFTGTALGTAGGLYTAAVTAVPEPESYAMMLAGLGVMGMIARRRKSKASA